MYLCSCLTPLCLKGMQRSYTRPGTALGARVLGAKEENQLRRAMSHSELGTAATETQRWALMNDLYDTQLQASQLRAEESSVVLQETEQQVRVLAFAV